MLLPAWARLAVIGRVYWSVGIAPSTSCSSVTYQTTLQSRLSQDADPKVEQYTCSLCLGPDGEDDCQFLDVYYKDLNDNAPAFVSSLPTSVEVAEGEGADAFEPWEVREPHPNQTFEQPIT